MNIPFAGAKKTALLVFFLAVLSLQTYSQTVRTEFEVTGAIDWSRGLLSAQAVFDMAGSGLRLPAERFLAEDIIKTASPRLLRPYLLSIRVDSDSTVGEMAARRELTFNELDTVYGESKKTPPGLSSDLLKMISRYNIQLGKLSALLTRHRTAREPYRPLVPVQTAAYTGIIIIAEGELPIHGRNSSSRLEPCLFPKIWDTEMNLVYERGMNEPTGAESSMMVTYTSPENIFRPTPSGLDAGLGALVGSNPLRIIARGVFGAAPTDPVIDRDDALKILSSDNNRRLLREGRVILALDAETLAISLPALGM